jgi:phage terminase large subunit-like protein
VGGAARREETASARCCIVRVNHQVDSLHDVHCVRGKTQHKRKQLIFDSTSRMRRESDAHVAHSSWFACLTHCHAQTHTYFWGCTRRPHSKHTAVLGLICVCAQQGTHILNPSSATRRGEQHL